MRRSLLLSLSILLALAGLTSCSGSDGSNAEKTTTSESPLYVSDTRECVFDAGFCATFPVMAGTSGDYSDKVSSRTQLGDELSRTRTLYFTEVYPGDEIEQYVVEVYPNTPEDIKSLEARYQEGWDCQLDPGLPFKASVCTSTFDHPDSKSKSVLKEMWVGGPDKLYVFQASTMSLNDPTYAGDFFASYSPSEHPAGN